MSSVRCVNCGDYTASIHLSIQVGGQIPEDSAVCTECVERMERQALGPVGSLAPHALLARLISEKEDPSFRCQACGFDVENLVRTGKLGCRQCYDAFGEEVQNLVRRAIGRETHRGKVPPLRLIPPE